MKHGCFRESARWEAASVPSDQVCVSVLQGEDDGGSEMLLLPQAGWQTGVRVNAAPACRGVGGGVSSVQSFTRQKMVLMIFAKLLKTART